MITRSQNFSERDEKTEMWLFIFFTKGLYGIELLGIPRTVFLEVSKIKIEE